MSTRFTVFFGSGVACLVGAGATGFVVIPKRWTAERTFAWLGRSRRLSKDYERRTDSSEAMIRLSSIHLLLKRLAPPATQVPFKYNLAA